jgi:Ca2+:H+ antiporter
MTQQAETFSRRRGWVTGAMPIFALAAAIGARDTEAAMSGGPRIALVLAAIGLLLVTVFIALHHAERVAARFGEPLGTLVLTLAVTVIEVSIIVSMMLHGANNPTLAREAVFAVVMIIGGGVVGLCLTVGALRFREQELKPQGTQAFLAVLIALSVLTLILPNAVGSARPGSYGTGQLAFVAITAALLYIAFLLMQTGRHRIDFLEEDSAGRTPAHAMPTRAGAALSGLLLLGGLLAVVLLAEIVAAGVEDGLAALRVSNPDRIVGALIACLVLLPETIGAIRAARANRLQRSLNIALGSALATIGLTIPAVSVVAIVTGFDLTLGLPQPDAVLLGLTLLLSVVSFGTGRTNMMIGLVHLVVFATYLFMVVVT